MFAVGAVFSPEAALAVEAQAATVVEALAAHRTSQYLNFVERPYDASGAFDADSWRRLQAVRAEADPDGVFLANHQIRSETDPR